MNLSSRLLNLWPETGGLIAWAAICVMSKSDDMSLWFVLAQIICGPIVWFFLVRIIKSIIHKWRHGVVHKGWISF